MDRVPFSYNGIQLIIPNDYNPNFNSFTVLIGSNGVGKSRLLSGLSGSLIEKTISTPTNVADYAYENKLLANQPKVITVSTSPFDTFKLPSKTNRRFQESFNYHYIGMRGTFSNSSSISLISSAAIGLLDKLLNSQGFDRLAKIFEVLGFEPSLEFIFKPMFRFNHNEAASQRSIFDSQDADELDIEKMLGVKLDRKLHYIIRDLDPYSLDEIRNALYIFSEFSDRRGHFRLRASYTNHWHYAFDFEHGANHQILNATLTLLKYELIKLMDLKLFKMHIEMEMSLRRASSGEQCMLVIMLGIAGHITDYSQIFIDEPEISLHPQWQEKFMSLLIEVFSTYTGCNFFIATHSPQIIAKLDQRNCYITSLTKHTIYSAADYMDRSADYQLAELFDTPGAMNEYLVRMAFGLMSRVKSNKEVTSKDLIELNKLTSFIDKIEAKDPLLGLINTVSEMCEYYAPHY
ncbi:AAA family ATPase [Pseudomonas sp. P5_109]|uniref:AAA family ATPase n=1 Tax=Pseudomonas sp. P5_109 TaxID=3043441 RepID=UPI002A361D3B|nr:AAA family ATPase [Pseudomonas sp. P5_109]WPN27693.1 AAA family ATPase [Pseudomonas sp. P5_109]